MTFTYFFRTTLGQLWQWPTCLSPTLETIHAKYVRNHHQDTTVMMIMLKLNYLTFIRSATDYCISILKPNLNRIRLHVAECASPALQDKGWHHCFISQILQFHNFRRFRDPTRGFVALLTAPLAYLFCTFDWFSLIPSRSGLRSKAE